MEGRIIARLDQQDELLKQIYMKMIDRIATLEDNMADMNDSIMNTEKKTLSIYTHIKSIASSLRVTAESDMENHPISRNTRRVPRNRAHSQGKQILDIGLDPSMSSHGRLSAKLPASRSSKQNSTSASKSGYCLSNDTSDTSTNVFSDLSMQSFPSMTLTNTTDTGSMDLYSLQGDTPGNSMKTTLHGRKEMATSDLSFTSSEQEVIEPHIQRRHEPKLFEEPDLIDKRSQELQKVVEQPKEDQSIRDDVEAEFSQTGALDLTNLKSVIHSLGLNNNKAAMNAIQQAFQSPADAGMNIKGLYTVLVLDTSSSMQTGPFTQMTAFVKKFLDEVDRAAGEKLLDENIAIVTCGAETRLAVDFTIDYSDHRAVIENLQPKGRTPLQTALALALCLIHNKSKPLMLENRSISPRIILISDGEVTDDSTFDGQDQEPKSVIIQTQTKILNLTKTLKHHGYQLCCVGVGNFNEAFLNTVVQGTSGQLVSADRPRVLGQYYYYQTVISKILKENVTRKVDIKGEKLFQLIKSLEPDILEEDIAEIVSLFPGHEMKNHRQTILQAPGLTLQGLPGTGPPSTSQGQSVPHPPTALKQQSVPCPPTTLEQSVTSSTTQRQLMTSPSTTPQQTVVIPTTTPQQSVAPLPTTPQQSAVIPTTTPRQSVAPLPTTPQQSAVIPTTTPQQSVASPPTTPQQSVTPLPTTPRQSVAPPPTTLGQSMAHPSITTESKPPPPTTPQQSVSPTPGNLQNGSNRNTFLSATASRAEWELCDMQEKNSGIPLGSRVIKGPHWPHGNSDDGVPGTVVAHQSKDHLYVLWDTGESGLYRYGINNETYDVFPTDQPRLLAEDGSMQMGCKVKRGVFWQRGDEDGGVNTVGTVVRKSSPTTILVRWPSGVIDQYKYEPDGVQEICVASPTEVFVSQQKAHQSQHSASSSSLKHVVWRWMDSQNNWHLFDEQTTKKIESDHKKGNSSVVRVDNCNLRLIFTKMEFRDMEKKYNGKIERVECSKTELNALMNSNNF
ncbi:hypothetical protein ScPMuIL_018458 [Solemya velum]